MKAVLLMTYASVKSIDDLSAFYTHIFHGRPPAPDVLEDAATRFRSIGVADPLGSVSSRQAAALERRLKQLAGEDIRVYRAAKHTPPFIDDTVRRIAADGVTRLYTLPLSPLYSRTGTAAYQLSVRKAVAAAGANLNVADITDWHLFPAVVEAVSLRLRTALRWLSAAARSKATVLFTAHSQPGLPEANREYIQAFAEMAQAVAAQANCRHWMLAYRSAGPPPQKWLRPDVTDSIKEAAQTDSKAIVICELSSLTENVEAIFDCRIRCQRQAEAYGLEFVMTEFLNDSSDFMDALADMILERTVQPLADS
ncbi:ferrochelatase [Paenibacillus sp. 32O-W]|uniref:ferrochelatase n=1 Tax=Paenibacillus sp. 32O-W TaxID=1695218 RepID=UPI0007225775|nr:ferrochelatase [Paenibacillus sp. 32O-W]ALS26571.1 ferrochelatase [Paenibacillus sp. 32O-W]